MESLPCNLNFMISWARGKTPPAKTHQIPKPSKPNPMKPITKFLAAALAVALTSSTSFAQLIAYENFNLTAGTNNLAGSSGNGSSGFSTNWTTIGDANGGNVISPGYTYSPIVSEGNRAQVFNASANSDSSATYFYRTLSTPYTVAANSTGTLWASFMIQSTAAATCGLGATIGFFDVAAPTASTNSGRFPGAANWALDWFGWVPGKRESRRFEGLHLLTEQDVLQARAFPDAIAYGGWPIDLHPPGGVDATDEMPCQHVHVPHLYGIPLRSCIARDIPNLLFAGRNISATHVAFATTRVMATCFAMGQGVGTAVAHAVRRGLDAHALVQSETDIQAIQQSLLRQDCFIPGISAADPADLARRARAAASSEQSRAPAASVIDGHTRATFGPGGTHPEQTAPGLHRWMSEPSAGLPAALTLAWDESVTVRSVQFIFDSGLHRLLTLSQSDKLTARMCWGRPQPELVADFVLEGRTENGWEPLSRIEGSRQRRVVVDLPASVTLRELRLTVLKTHGIDHARVCEVRVYGD